MLRLLHARPLWRRTLSLALLCIVATQTVAFARQEVRQRQEQRARTAGECAGSEIPDDCATGDEASHEDDAVDAGATLLLTPSRFQTAVGRRVRLTLTVLGAHDLRRLPVTVRFDPGVIELVSVDLGAAWDGRPEPAFLHDSSRPGELVIGLAQWSKSDPGIFGFAELLELEFRAVARGDTALVLERFAAVTGDTMAPEATALTARIVVQ